MSDAATAPRRAPTTTLGPGTKLAADGPDRTGHGPSERLKSAMGQALKRLREAEGATAATALYRMPWYLFAGEEAATAALLRAGCAEADLRGRNATPDSQGWAWWLLPKLVGILIGDGLLPGATAAPGAEVALDTALDLLRQNRGRLPLNGIVLAVDAASLRDAEAARDRAVALRRVVDAACSSLRRAFPVTILVTGLEALPGHAAFFDALPPAVGLQALGHLQDPPDTMTEPEARIAAAYATMIDRLERVRLGLLLNLFEERYDRHGIFRFVEALAELGPGLDAFGRALFTRDSYGRGPGACWRGLFLTAPQAPAPELRHVADLLARFLPQDAGLLPLA